MKVYKKKLREIVIDNIEFKYLVVEEMDNVIVRVYSTSYKSTFFEVYFIWKELHDINLYRPKTIELLIRCGLDKGWNYKRHNDVLKIEDSTSLIKELNLKKI